MRQTIAILTIFIISGCCTIPDTPSHPELTFPEAPELPKFTREMLDCGKHNPDTLPLCRLIKKREATIWDYSETLKVLTKEHNEALKQ